MSNESPGFFRQLPSALPGLALIIITMVVIRLWIEPWMAHTKVFGMEKPLIRRFPPQLHPARHSLRHALPQCHFRRKNAGNFQLTVSSCPAS